MCLSIIIPVYNVAEYLPKCLDSLVCQDLTDCEILLIDDGSTDGRSGAICDEYADKYPMLIRVIHQENGGLGAARNAGLAIAVGEYVLFIDSDDYVAPQMIDTLRPQMERGTDIVFFGFLIVQNNEVVSLPSYERCRSAVCLEEAPERLLETPSAWNKLWKRSLFTDNGIWFPPRLWYEDMATTPKLLACAETIASIPDDLYFYVLRDGSITRNRNVRRNLEIITAMRESVDWFRTAGLFDRYHKEFEALTVRNVLLDASVRVLKMEGTGEERERTEVLKELRRFTDRTFPDWPRNPYRKELPFKRRVVLVLLRLRCFRAVRLIFRLSDRRRKGEYKI